MPQLIWKIAAPMSVGMFFNTMFNVVDTVCAGWLGTEAQAALSISFPVFFLVAAAGSGMAQGTTALMANALGAGNQKEARKVFLQALSFVVAVALVLSSLGLLAAPRLFKLLGAEGQYLNLALSYIRVIYAGGVFFLLTMVLNSALSAQGETKLYRNVLIMGFFANLLLNPTLMWGWLGLPAMGVAGIALATVLVMMMSAGLLWRHLRQTDLIGQVSWSDFTPQWPIWRKIAAQAIPAGLNMLTIGLGIFIITYFVKPFGKEAVAAYGIATRIEQILLMPTIGLNSAALAIVGQNYGAGLFGRVREAWRLNTFIGAGLMLFGGLLLFAFRAPVFRLFTSDPLVIEHGVNYLLTAALTLAAYPILFVTMFSLQGLKRPAYSLWMGLYRQIIAPIGVFYLLSHHLGWGAWGIWWGVSMVTWSAALFALFWGKRVFNRLEKTSGTGM